MPGRKSDSSQSIDEVSRIRQRLDDINNLHHRHIRDQLELAMCSMMEFLNEKPRLLEEYAQNLRGVSRDDIGQELLDNILEQVRQIKTELNKTIDPPADGVAVLDDANDVFSKNTVLLGMINKLQRIEAILHTRVGEPATEEN